MQKMELVLEEKEISIIKNEIAKKNKLINSLTELYEQTHDFEEFIDSIRIFLKKYNKNSNQIPENESNKINNTIDSIFRVFLKKI
jgi:hypothetical protein